MGEQLTPLLFEQIHRRRRKSGQVEAPGRIGQDEQTQVVRGLLPGFPSQVDSGPVLERPQEELGLDLRKPPLRVAGRIEFVEDRGQSEDRLHGQVGI